MSVETVSETIEKNSHAKKVLLAEDDDSMRRFVEIILKQAGYEVTAVENGLTAMQTALENEYDALVTDAIMPNFSGYDLCRSLRSNVFKHKIPCIILSGLKQNELSVGDENIADALLIKDANLKHNLLELLANLLKKNRNNQR